jgi:hypothetical protein
LTVERIPYLQFCRFPALVCKTASITMTTIVEFNDKSSDLLVHAKFRAKLDHEYGTRGPSAASVA